MSTKIKLVMINLFLEVSDKLEAKILEALKKFFVIKFQFKIELVLKRSADDNITNLWGHINNEVIINNSTNH
jgi:hypothetical protein